MNLYLTKHQYKNTFTEDLWSALEEASNKPVGAVMSSWTKQMGFPVVRIQAVHQEGTDLKLTLSQDKFCADGSSTSGFQSIDTLSQRNEIKSAKLIINLHLRIYFFQKIFSGWTTNGGRRIIICLPKWESHCFPVR